MNQQLDRFSCAKGEKVIGTIDEFWNFHFTNEWALLSEISEFIVAKALNVDKASNKDYWTLFDINYNGIKVEVKETSYCHSWELEATTAPRVFGIEKSYGYLERITDNFKRYNDVYVFCLNTINIFERLGNTFNTEQAFQQSLAVKGSSSVTQNMVRMMLKNWRKQGLIIPDKDGSFRKCQSFAFAA